VERARGAGVLGPECGSMPRSVDEETRGPGDAYGDPGVSRSERRIGSERGTFRARERGPVCPTP
jgi:hypothetical protein